MKRTKVNSKLKRQLELVRSTLRTLTPTELGRVNGGGEDEATLACATRCYYTECYNN